MGGTESGQRDSTWQAAVGATSSIQQPGNLGTHRLPHSNYHTQTATAGEMQDRRTSRHESAMQVAPACVCFQGLTPICPPCPPVPPPPFPFRTCFLPSRCPFGRGRCLVCVKQLSSAWAIFSHAYAVMHPPSGGCVALCGTARPARGPKNRLRCRVRTSVVGEVARWPFDRFKKCGGRISTLC